ncbi:predicted protein [Uncinocarpus reesii 1704]|uniref:Uncharacterized protein n=1 Tax=Uncinocarpus reesii (strain UAMH 1704) TaxID=336963 RepID=C4JZZ1_UNCRE|nr:uncharacterized protein UREG_07742 [Uncinocarpus reesii 1704]EEP82877.1 predicted protein [Uncinocarpus reesii 1704]
MSVMICSSSVREGEVFPQNGLGTATPPDLDDDDDDGDGFPQEATAYTPIRYHWGFLMGPKEEAKNEVPGMRFHVKNAPGTEWIYEEVRLANVRSTINLLARIVVAKVEDEERLKNILRSVPVVQNDPDWSCWNFESGLAED